MIQDAVVQEGNYELDKEDDQLFIRFAPNAMDTTIFSDHEKTITFSNGNNNLTLTDPCCDLFIYTFIEED